MRICYDLDNTLCSGTPYEESKPFPGAAKHLRTVKKQGHTIIISTARCMKRTGGNPGLVQAQIAHLTFRQLEEWGFEYDEIYFGKPAADLYVDDKALRVVEYSKTYEEVETFCANE